MIKIIFYLKLKKKKKDETFYKLCIFLLEIMHFF